MKSSSYEKRLSFLLTQYRDVLRPLLSFLISESCRLSGNNASSAALALFRNQTDDYFKRQLFSLRINQSDKALAYAEEHYEKQLFECYRLLCSVYRDYLSVFEKRTRYLDLRTVDQDGSFSALLSCYKSECLQKESSANQNLAQNNTAKAIADYDAAICSYSILSGLIENNSRCVSKGRIQLFWRIVSPAITFVAGCIITNNNELIVKWFLGLFGVFQS